jgi:predicted transposase YbfD/YdcC
MQEAASSTEALCCSHEQEQTRGRHEERRLEVYAAPEGVQAAWPGLRRVLRVVRSGRREGADYWRESFYATSLVAEASLYARGIRGHWLIENRLHYVKDVVMHEDGSGIRSREAAATLSLLKSWVLNLYRKHGYDSPRHAAMVYANRVKELLVLIRT